MRAALLVATVALLLGAGAAVAGRYDPHRAIRPADQARARAMLLRATDFPNAVARMKPSGSSDATCKALDESDLVLSGEAASEFGASGAGRYRIAGSEAMLYETASQSARAWRQTTSAAALTCYRLESERKPPLTGAKLVSLRRVAFPRVAPQTYVLRAVVEVQGLRSQSDVVGLRNGRAQVALAFVGLPTPYPGPEELRLARVTAKRMAKAMRGA